MRKRLSILALFALAFAFVEAAVVVYLHQILPIEETHKLFYEPPPTILTLPFIAFLKSPGTLFPDPWLLRIEHVRELATLTMLVSIAWIWGKDKIERFWAFIFAFSLWDLGYYLFLNRTLGWPNSLWEIDVFFLVPVPWVGPIIVPIVLFSVLLLVAIPLLMRQRKSE